MASLNFGIGGLILLILVLMSPLAVLKNVLAVQTQAQESVESSEEENVEVLLKVLNESIVRVEALLTSWNVSLDSEAWEHLRKAKLLLEDATILVESGDFEGAKKLVSEGFEELGEAVEEAKPEKPVVNRSLELKVKSKIEKFKRQLEVLVYAASKIVNVTVRSEVALILEEANKTLLNATIAFEAGNYTLALEKLEFVEELMDKAKDLLEDTMEDKVREKAVKVLEEAHSKIEEAIEKVNETIKMLNETLGEEAAVIIEKLNATIERLVEVRENITRHLELALNVSLDKVAFKVKELLEEEEEWEEDVESKSEALSSKLAPTIGELNVTLEKVKLLLNKTENHELKLQIKNIVNETSNLQSLIVDIAMELARGEGGKALNLTHNATVKVELLHKTVEVVIDKLKSKGVDPEPLENLKHQLEEVKESLEDVKEDAKKVKKQVEHEEEHEEEEEAKEHREEHREHHEEEHHGKEVEGEEYVKGKIIQEEEEHEEEEEEKE